MPTPASVASPRPATAAEIRSASSISRRVILLSSRDRRVRMTRSGRRSAVRLPPAMSPARAVTAGASSAACPSDRTDGGADQPQDVPPAEPGQRRRRSRRRSLRPSHDVCGVLDRHFPAPSSALRHHAVEGCAAESARVHPRPTGLDQLDGDDLGPGDGPVPFVGEQRPSPVGHVVVDGYRGREFQQLDLERVAAKAALRARCRTRPPCSATKPSTSSSWAIRASSASGCAHSSTHRVRLMRTRMSSIGPDGPAPVRTPHPGAVRSRRRTRPGHLWGPPGGCRTRPGTESWSPGMASGR